MTFDQQTAHDQTAHERTFHELWDAAVASHHDRLFLLFRDDHTLNAYSYEEFDRVVAETAGVLRAAGVEPGSCVHLALTNCPAFVAAWLAAARLGAWIVPADPASTARDIASQVRRIRPVVALCAAARADVYRAGAAGAALAPDVAAALAPDVAAAPAPNVAAVPLVVELSETAADVAPGGPLSGGEPVAAAVPGIGPRDRLAVMFTSGTTSEPKGVVLTQENYRTVGTAMAAAVDLRPEHRWLVTLPLFHANAQYYCFAPAIATGAAVALTHTFSASRWVRQADELGVTHASLFAAPIRMILARCGDELPSLRMRHVWFAQSLGEQHYERFAAIIGCRPRQLYGMTETIAAVTGDTSVPLRHDVIGEPLGGREIAVVDPVDGTPAAAGTPGVLRVRGVRGADLFAGYLDDPETTGRSFIDLPDGTSWFSTGDLVATSAAPAPDVARAAPAPDVTAAPASEVADRRLRFVGRVDDVIKVSGENVSLTEVESVLAQAPGVLEAAVVARPDPTRDVVPVAYLVPRDASAPPDLDEVARWAAGNLPPAARPREWHLIDELPRTSVGKVRRFRIGPA